MFGKNEVAGPMYDPDGRLLVHDIWLTIQGEGPDAGRPAFFIRLAKCNLRCFFCDTEFDTGVTMTPQEISTRMLRLLADSDMTDDQLINTPELVVITGGEPLLQNIIPLVDRLNYLGIEVAIETAGTVYPSGLDRYFVASRALNGNAIICSPKTPKLNERIPELVNAYKYIIRAGETDKEDGLPIMSTQREGESARLFRPPEGTFIPIYVQPCDEGDPVRNKMNMDAAVLSAMHYGYRLSIQTHKIAGLK